MTAPIDAVQHVRKMRGGSQAHLLRCSDGGYYVTKFQGNPQHTRILANEMFATRAGLWLSLPMPAVAIVQVGEWLIEKTPDLRFEIASQPVKCIAGQHLGSRYVGDPLTHASYDYLPESMLAKVTNLADFVRVLVLDKWLGNADGRQAVFSRRVHEPNYRVFFVDHGYCFNAGDWTFPDSALRGTYARNDVYADVTGWESFEPTLTRAEECGIDNVWEWARSIPSEWYEHRFDELEQLVDAVYMRRKQIRNLIEEFRNSSRQPFPNWSSHCCVAQSCGATASL
jgi:hypothetical protein